MSYEGENKRKWSVNKEISLGDLICLATAFSGLFMAYNVLNTRIALVEQAQAALAAEQDRSVKRMEQAVSEINHKLDRLIERR